MTITGAGGIGKTRLAIETARSRAGRFVSLASTAAVEQVPSAILDALGLAQTPGESAEESLHRALAGERMLLVLDNLEHLVPAATLLAELLDRAPGIAVLATSRQALGLRAERLFPVSPLGLPAEGDLDAGDSPAVELFADRARACDPAFEPIGESLPAVVEICRRLDGVPLAIELAAGRVGVLGAAELSARLADALSVLGPGPQDAPARQRTVRATLDWSYDLLDVDERDAFVALGVFAGGCDVEAAEAVTGHAVAVLEALAAKSLVIARGGRLSSLEPVRQYAAQRLARRADADAVRSRHLGHYLDLAEATEYELLGSRPLSEGVRPSSTASATTSCAALAWAIERRPVEAVALAGAMGAYWQVLPTDDEARRWCRLALDGTDERTAYRLGGACAPCVGKQRSSTPRGRRASTSRARALQEASLTRPGSPSALNGPELHPRRRRRVGRQPSPWPRRRSRTPVKSAILS